MSSIPGATRFAELLSCKSRANLSHVTPQPCLSNTTPNRREKTDRNWDRAPRSQLARACVVFHPSVFHQLVLEATRTVALPRIHQKKASPRIGPTTASASRVKPSIEHAKNPAADRGGDRHCRKQLRNTALLACGRCRGRTATCRTCCLRSHTLNIK